MITVRGEGSEPKVEFTSSVLEFGPILSHSFGDEKEVTVPNPSSFPVEIYSLEFDKQYLEEEKVIAFHYLFYNTNLTSACFILYISVAFNAVLTVVNGMSQLTVYFFN